MKRLLLTMMLLCPLGANAAFYTGNQLQAECEGTNVGEPNASVAKYNACGGFLRGVADAAGAINAWGFKLGDRQPPGICMPHNVPMEQLRQIWLKYAAKYPEELPQAASSMALYAYDLGWPCKK